MNRPDFTEVNRLIRSLSALDESYQNMFSRIRQLEEDLQRCCESRLLEQAARSLSEYSVDELKKSNARLRTEPLHLAGIHTMLDLHRMTDAELLAVPQVGEKTLEAARTMADGLLHSLAKRERILLRDDAPDPRNTELIGHLYRLRQAEAVRRDAEPLRDELHAAAAELCGRIPIRSSFRWLFSLGKKKEETVRAIGDLILFCRSPLCTRAQQFLTSLEEILGADAETALADFRKNSPAYYALLEKYTGSGVPEELVYSSIPAQLAAKIRETDVNLSAFHGDLRAYQEFGVRYILHQKKVLLGDEMGLGKTIQAIAAMCHLRLQADESHFLVVCPASVLINWCREIRRFSEIPVHLLHGAGREEAFARWRAGGGAAVVSYESLDRLVKGIDGKMTLALLVIDEAHYIKNPEAKRTRNIRSLYEESDRILLMTGTPLENRVDEMCELIRFVRPDLEEGIRRMAVLRAAPEFREALAPVYLRRLREQVLTELPPATVQEEWCEMTEEDRAAYARQVEAGQFQAMRRVSFLQEDLSCSSKTIRLAELCDRICDEGRKAVIYSWFRETIRKLEDRFAGICAGTITGSTPVPDRQRIIDEFQDGPGGRILICQIQSGGVGLNLQAASVVIFCEPQIKPSLTHQALSRVWRMGQIRNVLVCHLLCEDTVDEAIRSLAEEKQEEFDLYAEESEMAEAADSLADRDWILRTVERERRKYLPAVTGRPV